MTIRPGVIFDTEYETGCRATSSPDVDGTFTAFDSDGVECIYGLRMVKRVQPALPEPVCRPGTCDICDARLAAIQAAKRP